KGHKLQRASAVLSALLLIALGNAAFAAEAEPNFGGIMNIVCTVQDFMSGPIAIALGIVILAVGGLMIAFGGKRSIPFVIWGIIGVSIAIAAPSLFNTLTGNKEKMCDGKNYVGPGAYIEQLHAPALAGYAIRFDEA